MHLPASHGDGGGSTIATLERALDVLQHLASGTRPDHGVSEVAEELGISKGSVHRVLASLCTRGLVHRSPETQRYALGPGVLRLGLAYMARADVAQLARPVLEQLSASTGETATLSVRLGRSQRVYADQVTPEREVIVTVSEGEAYSLHEGASGRAFLAFLPEHEREQLLDQLALCPTPAGRSVAELRAALAAARREGWTRSRGERLEGALSVAAPVLDHRGEPIAVMSVCGPAERFEPRVPAHVVHLLDAAGGLSDQFGGNV